jgi:hypothetical protein
VPVLHDASCVTVSYAHTHTHDGRLLTPARARSTVYSAHKQPKRRSQFGVEPFLCRASKQVCRHQDTPLSTILNVVHFVMDMHDWVRFQPLEKKIFRPTAFLNQITTTLCSQVAPKKLTVPHPMKKHPPEDSCLLSYSAV